MLETMDFVRRSDLTDFMSEIRGMFFTTNKRMDNMEAGKKSSLSEGVPTNSSMSEGGVTGMVQSTNSLTHISQLDSHRNSNSAVNNGSDLHMSANMVSTAGNQSLDDSTCIDVQVSAELSLSAEQSSPMPNQEVSLLVTEMRNLVKACSASQPGLPMASAQATPELNRPSIHSSKNSGAQNLSQNSYQEKELGDLIMEMRSLVGEVRNNDTRDVLPRTHTVESGVLEDGRSTLASTQDLQMGVGSTLASAVGATATGAAMQINNNAAAGKIADISSMDLNSLTLNARLTDQSAILIPCAEATDEQVRKVIHRNCRPPPSWVTSISQEVIHRIRLSNLRIGDISISPILICFSLSD